MAGLEDQSTLSDWNLPLSFMKNRHKEKIEGMEKSENSWRMKDRVSTKNSISSSPVLVVFVLHKHLQRR